MISNKIKLVTFDATNTLLKFCVSPWEYYAKIADEHGYQVKEDDIKKQFLVTYKMLTKDYPNFGKESILWENWWRKVVQGTFKEKIKDTDKIKNIADNLIEDYKSPKCWCTAKGAVELLKLLKTNGINLGVISNFDPRLHEVLREVDLNVYFKFVLTSYEIGYSKPNKIIFDSAITHSKLNVLPKECLHVGDNYEKDYKGAKDAGWQAVLVTENKEKFDKLNPKQCFRNLCELKEEIENQKLFL